MKPQDNTKLTLWGIVALVVIIIAGVAFARNASNQASNQGQSLPPVSTVSTSTYTGTGTTTSTVPPATSTVTVIPTPITTQSTNTGSAATSNPTNISTPAQNENGWRTTVNSSVGLTYSYPASLSTSYIQTPDWPPSIAVTNNQFICTQAGSASAPAGQTNLVNINDNPYCVTVEANGAAGSIYYQYAYVFPKAGKTMVMTFTLRYPQCMNYDGAQQAACKNEESTVNVNQIADAIAQTVKYVAPVSTQPTQPVASSTTAISLNSISPASGPVGTSVTLTGFNFTSTNNKVLFDGDVAASDAHLSAVANNGIQSITFTVPNGIGPDCQTSEPCPMYERLVTPATYSVIVENANGQSNVLSFVVTQ